MQNLNSEKNPAYSIVIPTFNADAFIERAVSSLQTQTFEDFEVIVVDDKSCDSTPEVLQNMASSDPRVRFFSQQENSGTLATRARGVAEANGDYVLLMDQDDELRSDALEEIENHLQVESVDILHFGVEVVPESEGAKKAATDCENWLTPTARSLTGQDILQNQFCEFGNFDWHVHHKVFKSELAKEAWGTYPHERLCTSDDFLMSYILCSRAKTYVALPNSNWYVYHLGAGETFGGEYSVSHWKNICDVDAKAFELIKNFESDGNHAEIVKNCQNKLIEHVANEMHDNLAGEDVDLCIDYALQSWEADAVAGELWRFVRDRANDNIACGREAKKDETLHTLIKQAKHAESFVGKSNNERHSQMKRIASERLREMEGPSFFQKVLARIRKG